jgi:hypothetical protein
VNTLQADRRWCLTGTPIQNRLEDVGALIRFLKVQPFDGKSGKAAFKRYIVDPLFSNDEDPCRNLRLLLRSICLRRTQNQSNLTATFESVALSLSPLEKSLYDKILEQSKKDMDMLVSTGSSVQKYTKLFTVILRLRMLCDLGNFCEGLSSLLSPIDMPQARSPSDLELDSDLGCDFCQKEESIDLMKDLIFCPNCSRLLPWFNTEDPDSSSKSLRPTKLCSPQSSYLSNESSGIIQASARLQQSCLEAGISAKGYPTKLIEVVKNLGDNIYHSKRSAKYISYSWSPALTLTYIQHCLLMLDEDIGYPG